MKKLALFAALVPLYSVADINLDTQYVTADKISESNISNSIIITKEEIDLLQASNLSEILLSLPGFQVTQQGGNANIQSFVMNGFRSDQILILLNGQRFSSATAGRATYNTIPSNIIQSIEIVSNARSAVYGSDALGGVINIVTTQNIEKDNSVRLALGNQNTTQASLDLNKTFNNISLHLTGFTEKTQGYDVSTKYDDDRDGSERHSLGFDTEFKINPQQSLSAKILNNRGSVDYDGSKKTSKKKDYQQQVSGIGWNYSDQDLAIQANYNESFDKSWNYDAGQSRSKSSAFITESKYLDITARKELNTHNSLLLVTDYREDDISKSDTAYDKTKGNIKGLGLSHTYAAAIISSEIGTRYDDSSLFTDSYSYSASAQWQALDNLSLIAAINTGFKAPSFNDLYYPTSSFGSTTYSSNPDLAPEKSLNRRLAIHYKADSSNYKISYQLSHVEDLIQNQKENNVSRPVNLDQVLLRNAVLSWKKSWSDSLKTETSYEWNHSIDLKSHRLLQRQSARVLKLNINYISGKLSSGANLRHLSESYDDAKNSDLLAAYTIADVYGDFIISSNFTLGLRINNIGNKDYQTAKGYPAQERTYLLNGTFNF